MVEAGASADRLLLAQSEEAAPSRRVGLAEVYPGTTGRLGTGQLTATDRVGRRQSRSYVHFTVRMCSPRYARCRYKPVSKLTHH